MIYITSKRGPHIATSLGWVGIGIIDPETWRHGDLGTNKWGDLTIHLKIYIGDLRFRKNWLH